MHDLQPEAVPLAPLELSGMSARGALYGAPGSLGAVELEALLAPNKGALSEYGWAYLVNDSNRFLPLLFGEAAWTQAEREAVRTVLAERQDILRRAGRFYWKFIVPEKAAVYPEYLPRALARPATWPIRPAQMMAADLPGAVDYLLPYLDASKSLGLSYFRGDTHTNWLGGWLVYRAIASRMACAGLIGERDILAYRHLAANVAAWDGDISTQAGASHRAAYDAVWNVTASASSFEVLTALAIAPQHRRADRVQTPADYVRWFDTRETFVYERADRQGPRAVIFRDSTLDRTHDLLAQHFARTVFVWHHGLVYDEVIAREQPDVVLHIMAERFVVMYPMYPPIATLPTS